MSNEFPKWFKNVLLINGVLFIIYGAIHVFVPEFYLIITDWPYQDTFYVQATGISIIVLGIFSLYAFRINEWEKMKAFFEFGILWLSLMTVSYIYATAALPLTDTAIISTIMNIIFYAITDILYISLYLKKLHKEKTIIEK